MQELIDTREAIEVKYHLTPEETGGFETIAQKVEAEVARAQVAQRLEQPSGLFHQARRCLSTGRPASFAAPPVMRVRLWNMTDCHQGVTAAECSLRYTLLDYVCKAQRKGFVP